MNYIISCVFLPLCCDEFSFLAFTPFSISTEWLLFHLCACLSVKQTTLQSVEHLVIADLHRARLSDCRDLNSHVSGQDVDNTNLVVCGKLQRVIEESKVHRKVFLGECGTQIARSSLCFLSVFTTTTESVLPPCQHAGLPGPRGHLRDQVAES